MTPLVTVVIPTTMRPGLVLRALHSVLAQSHSALDVIVIMDGPNPETRRVLETVTDGRVRMMQTDPSAGAGAARNQAAAAARGSWIAFLDDDDAWLPNKLERQLAAAAGREVLVSCCSRVHTSRGSEVWPRRLYDGSEPVDEYLFDRRTLFRGDAYIGTSSYLMPTALFARTQFSTDRQNEDTTLLLRVTKLAGASIVMVPDTLVLLFKEEGRASLGRNFEWREMLQWLDTTRPLVTRRAYSGFCLIYLGSQAAQLGDLSAWPVLIGRAFSCGAPTLPQLGLFFAFWLVPVGLRLRLRNWVALRRRSAATPC